MTNISIPSKRILNNRNSAKEQTEKQHKILWVPHACPNACPLRPFEVSSPHLRRGHRCLCCLASPWKLFHEAIEESHSLSRKAAWAFTVVQLHQVKFLQALGWPGAGETWARRVGVRRTGSQTVMESAARWAWGGQGVRQWWSQPHCRLALVCVHVCWLQLRGAWGLAFGLEKPLMNKIIVHIFSSFLIMFKNLLFYFLGLLIFINFLKSFYFILEYGWLTVLWHLDSEGTQPHKSIFPFTLHTPLIQVPRNTEPSFLWGLCWLSILNLAECTYPP